MDAYGHMLPGAEADAADQLGAMVSLTRADDHAEENIVRMTGTDGPDGAQRVAQQSGRESERRHATPRNEGDHAGASAETSQRSVRSENAEQNAPLGHSVRSGTIGNCQIRRVSELASGLTRNQVSRKGLWVRIPCPPLFYLSSPKTP